MEKDSIKSIVIEQKKLNKFQGVTRNSLEKVSDYIKTPHAVIITGVRRTGKSTLLHQILLVVYF